MVALPKSRLFECSINEQMLDYNGKNFLAEGRLCPHKRRRREEKLKKKCISEIKKLTTITRKLEKKTHAHMLDYNWKNFNADFGVRFTICTPQQIFT
jgi:hypothetical protein